MVLTLIDALPYLSLDLLEEWLDIAAGSINDHITDEDGALRQVCRERFWEVLSSGEMSNDRAALCVAWWTTRGGREAVMEGGGRGDDFSGVGVGVNAGDGVSGVVAEQSKL